MNRRTFLTTTSVAGAAFALGTRTALSQSNPPRIRVGQIGTGHAHASGKMDALRRLPDYEVVGIVEPDPARRAAAVKSSIYQGLKWMTAEELLNVKGLQAVAVETEVCDLLDTAERCVAAGKHIHLDKPAGESLSQFKRILAAATRQKLTVQMGYMFRSNPAFQLCFKAVREGWLGNVFSVDAVIGKAMDASSRQPLLKYPGGTMFELGCHVIDAVITVLGRPRKVTAHNRSSSTLNDGFADNQLAVLDYPKATATVRSSIIEVDGGARRQFVVCGDQGTFDIRPLESPHARLALSQPREGFKKGYQDVNFPKLPRYDAELADLAKVIRDEKAFGFTPEHDLTVQETVLLASGLPLR